MDFERGRAEGGAGGGGRGSRVVRDGAEEQCGGWVAREVLEERKLNYIVLLHIF